MGVCLLILVFNALYYTVISLVQHFAGSGTGTLNGSTATITTTAPIATIDNMSLAQLESLSFSNSTKCTSFLSPSWWDAAIRASGETTLTMVPNTAYGLVQSYSGWSAYFGVNASYF